MKSIHYLKNWDQVQAIANPTRLGALHHLTKAAFSPLELAKVMQVKPTTLYHHLEALAEVNLIEVVAERQARGCTERTYRAIARDFVLDQTSLRSPSATTGLANLLISALESALLDAKESAESLAITSERHDAVRALRVPLRASPDTLSAIHAAIEGIIETCKDSLDGKDPDAILTLVMHPTTSLEKEKL